MNDRAGDGRDGAASSTGRLAPALNQAAEMAFGRAGLYEASIEVAGEAVRLRFAGRRLRDEMLPAFEHVMSTVADDAETRFPLGALEVAIWDSTLSGVPLPAEVGRPSQHQAKGLGQLRGAGEILSFYDADEGSLSIIDIRHARAVHWTLNAAAVSEREKAAPLQAILNWWLPARGCTVVHAAAIGTAEGAVLLFGQSGAGKSTTALTGFDQGLHYLADDFCAVRFADEMATAWSLFCSGKLFPHNLEGVSGFAALAPAVPAGDSRKAIAYLFRAAPERVVRSLPVRAAVALTAKGLAEPSLSRLSPSRAVLKFAPTTLFNLPGPGEGQLKGIARLTRTVPCYEMQLARDYAANIRALRRLLAGVED